MPEKARASKTTRTSGSLEFAGQHVAYDYLPAAHTDGDLYVHFPEANVLVAGGPVCGDRWPVLDIHNGGWLGGLVRGYEKLASVVKPDTRVVGAEGKLLTGADVVRYHDTYQKLFTQMFEFFNGIVDASAVDETLRVPSVRVQPIAADEAAGAITNLATAKPSNSIVEIGGPEAFELVEIAQELLTAAEDPRPVVLDPTARYFGVALSKDGLLPSCIIATGTLSFHEWLFTSMSVQDVA